MSCKGILHLAVLAGFCLVPCVRAGDEAVSPFAKALSRSEQALEKGDLEESRRQLQRALERDARSAEAWALRARWGEAAKDLDERIYALHRRFELLTAQEAPAGELRALRAQILELDPLAKRSLDLAADFTDDLLKLARAYEKEKRPHSAIQVYQKLLALNPEREDMGDAIARISAEPDPSLAETARPRDVMAEVSAEWVREFDAKHSDWENAARLERDSYTTKTDAGYEVLLRTSEAMEQMSAFYRQFFGHGCGRDRGRVPRIEVLVFRDRETYLKEGTGPPVSWSGGQFAGHAVETYIGTNSFERMTRTLFHEAAHQFVSLTNGARGWLNEGLASYFEGCRILANGTVLMNLPAEHRLFALADRMSAGWMSGSTDGIDPADPSKSKPAKAPRIGTIIRSEYKWGPAWYAPTWGVVYLLHNYQDPGDGRFVYRKAFWEFVNSGGLWCGPGAVEKFEKIVLRNPAPPTPGVEAAKKGLADLPRSLEALDKLWRDWTLSLRDDLRGTSKADRPWLDWARHAIARKQHGHATELFEKGLLADPENCELLAEFAEHLRTREKNPDRAAKLLRKAMVLLESRKEPNVRCIQRLERLVEKWDPHYRSLRRLEERLVRSSQSIVRKYLEAGQHLMTMHTCSRLAGELDLPEILDTFEEAARISGKSLSIWRLAYNERDLEGWARDSKVFLPQGEILAARYGQYVPNRYNYTFLTLDTVTSGDFSMEAQVRAEPGRNAFCGLVFGRRGLSDFHTLIFFPQGNVDLASFRGAGRFKTWRSDKALATESPWRALRIDVVGRVVDVWCDGEFLFTQEFESLDLLRGSFGLITGLGEADFRNIRFLAREPRDPGARLERKIRMEKHGRATGPVGGSYMGKVPPWPVVKEWVQGEPTGWAEKGRVPTILLLWSIRQNEMIPLHKWLDHLEKKYSSVGLRIVSVCEAGDGQRIRDYLAGRKFPGSVGVDLLDPRSSGLGETLDGYFIGSRYNFPRMLLLDIDQRVVWEGNPGFALNTSWRPGAASMLDTPLEELVTRRKLHRLPGWLDEWAKEGAPALAEGDLEAAAALVRESAELPGDVVAEVALAQSVLRRVAGEIQALKECADTLAEADRGPALAVLLEWAKALGKPPAPGQLKSVAKRLKTRECKGWATVRKRAEKLARLLRNRPDNAAAVRAFVKRVTPQPGTFVAELTREIGEALDAEDLTRVRKLVEGIKLRPARWLAREYFGFRSRSGR